MWAPMRALRAGSQEDNASKRFPVDVATPDFESSLPTEISYQYKQIRSSVRTPVHFRVPILIRDPRLAS